MTAATAIDQQELGGINPWAVAFAVSLAAFMEVLDTTITNVSLSHIAGSLGASADESTWVLTSYLVANGIVLPLSGWLAGVFGRKRYFMGCIAAFTAASFLCGAATTLPMLIVFRLLQGIAGGGLQPTQQAIIVDAFPPEKRGAAFGVTGITMIVAPILGPTLGGFITDNFSWRWIFYLNVPVGIFALWMVSMMVRDPLHAMAQGLKKIDYVGLSLIVLGLGALQIVLDKGQQDDWFGSSFITMMATISGTSLVCAVFWLLNQADPIVELRLLGKRGFGLSCLMIFCVGVALYSSSALLPILTQSEFGYNATISGLVLSPGAFAVVFLMPVSGKLVGKIPARYLIAVGFLLTAIGMMATSFISPETDYRHFVFMRTLQVLGLPFLFIPVATLAFIDIPKELSSKASALFSLARNIGGSIGIAVIYAYVARKEQVHQTTLATAMTPGNPYYRALLHDYAQRLIGHGYSAATSGAGALGRVYQELLRQVIVLSYDDAFRVLAVVMIALSALAFTMPYNNPHAKKAAAPAH
jgi:DHA2 family multidrug resistance protein